MRLSWACAGLLCLAASPVSAGKAPDMKERPSVGALRPYRPPKTVRFKLSNVTPMIFVEDHRFPLVTVRLALKGGTSMADRGDAGIVEALAELLTEGTEDRTALQIAEAADAFGGTLSASATRDHVVVESFSLAERAGDMFALLGEVLSRATFPEREVELRKKNMLEELKLKRSQPGFLAREAFYKTLYPRHPYGVVSPSEESIARITRHRLRSLYGRQSIPVNAVLVVVGDLNPESARALVERELCSRWGARQGLPRWHVPAPKPASPGRRRLVLADRSGSEQSTLIVGHAGITEKHEDYYPLLVANQILGGSFASRLMDDLRQKKGYTYGVYSWLDAGYAAGEFKISAQVRTKVTKASLKRVLKHLKRMRKRRVKAVELTQAKNMLVGDFARKLETQSGVADAVLHGVLFDLPEDRLERHVERVRSVTRDDVRRAARGHLRPSEAVLTVVGDAKALGKSLRRLAR